MAVFLGTGASQGYPSPFCNCPVCEDARKVGGKAIKTRCDFLIDEKNMIDYGPDIYWQIMRNGMKLDEIENIFLTHFHEDHIDITELAVIRVRKPPLEKPVSVNLYGSKAALDDIEKFMDAYCVSTGKKAFESYYRHIHLCRIEPFITFETGGLKVTPIMSSHQGYGKDELGYNYIVEKNGKTMLYACDTGWYSDDTWDFLANSDFKFDYVIMENTYGADLNNIVKPYTAGHLNTANFINMLEKMEELGCISHTTPVYATHLSDSGRELFGDFVDSLENNPDWNILVAYDSMNLDF